MNIEKSFIDIDNFHIPVGQNLVRLGQTYSDQLEYWNKPISKKELSISIKQLLISTNHWPT